MSSFHLNLSLMTPGHFRQAWRLPDRDPLGYLDVDRFARLAQLAEEAGIDAVFLGDAPALRGEIASAPGTGLDPVVLLGHLAAVTENLGIIATSSSTFNSPYNLARRFQALDHVTKGRVAVNIVTTAAPAAAANFGLASHPDKETRYRRAWEFLDVVTRLWDSWEPDWLIADRDAGRFADPERIRPIDYTGEFFSVAGPLPVPPGPQGRPLVVQAGGSPGGLRLAADFADVVFTVAQTRERAAEFRGEVRDRVAGAGRDPETVKVSLGVVVLVGETRRDVQERLAELAETLPIEAIAARLLSDLGLDPDRFGLDDPICAADLPAQLPGSEFSTGFGLALRGLIARGPITPRELAVGTAGGSGHRLLAGTPAQIADDLAAWFTAGAADGFTIMPADTDVDFERFTRAVVPILVERGLFRTGYPRGGLRGRLVPHAA